MKSVETPLSVAAMADTQYSAAVIPTESVHISIERGAMNRSVTSHDASADTTDTAVGMKTVDLQNGKNPPPATGIIRQGFGNSSPPKKPRV